jgi:hypothetical protein
MDKLLEWLPYLVPIFVIQIGLMVLAIADLIRREATKGLPKWAWALVIVLINIIGPVVYLAAGRDE